MVRIHKTKRMRSITWAEARDVQVALIARGGAWREVPASCVILVLFFRAMEVIDGEKSKKN